MRSGRADEPKYPIDERTGLPRLKKNEFWRLVRDKDKGGGNYKLQLRTRRWYGSSLYGRHMKLKLHRTESMATQKSRIYDASITLLDDYLSSRERDSLLGDYPRRADRKL